MRTIITAPGIGDFLWLLMRLINLEQPEKFDWVFSTREDDIAPNKAEVQTRAFQIQPLLPQLINSVSHKSISWNRQIKGNSPKRFSDAKNSTFYLEANSHLENGFRIEQFLPDITNTSFILPFQTSEKNKREAKEILSTFKNGEHKICGIYTSSHAPRDGSWNQDQWAQIINLIKQFNPNYKFVFIGAGYDEKWTMEVANKFDQSDYTTCIDQDLGTAIEVQKGLDIMIGFQSGMTILNELIGAPQTVMLYWRNKAHRNIIESWAEPRRMNITKQYKGCEFDAPSVIYKWLIDNNKL